MSLRDVGMRTCLYLNGSRETPSALEALGYKIWDEKRTSTASIYCEKKTYRVLEMSFTDPRGFMAKIQVISGAEHSMIAAIATLWSS